MRRRSFRRSRGRSVVRRVFRRGRAGRVGRRVRIGYRM